MSVPLPSSEALVADPLFPALKERVVGSTGLAYYKDRDTDFAHRIRRRLSSVGATDCTAYLDILGDPHRGPPELDALIAEITIGETYFFRHGEHFEALRDVVMPDLIARNAMNRRLRIWSAGCADGPEPYSLAILLRREMAHQLPGWQISIVATDINRQCLARAREGRFDEWALRSTPEDVKNTCFRREGGCWSIAPVYKEWVTFQYHNMVEHPFPSLINNLSAFDLIVCRNVMIYFAPSLMRRIVRQFHECLLPGAWLLVGPTEPNMTCFTSFRGVNAPGVTLYQKPAEQISSVGTPISLTLSLPHVPNGGPVCERKSGEELEPTLAAVRSYADAGAWEDAARCCERLLQKDLLNSAVHFHHALVLEQMSRHVEAERSLRHAIYLDRQAVLPHYYLGLFLQSRGDLPQAARSFENAFELLRARDGGVLPDADGITVGEMKNLAKMHLDILREQV